VAADVEIENGGADVVGSLQHVYGTCRRSIGAENIYAFALRAVSEILPNQVFVFDDQQLASGKRLMGIVGCIALARLHALIWSEGRRADLCVATSKVTTRPDCSLNADGN